jgi:hypothetical protein
MRRSINALACLLVAGLLCAIAAPAAPAQKPQKGPVPSGPLKAYKGPEGEVIAMVEVNGSKQMLVHFKNLGGDLEGKTLLYLFEDHGDDKTVYLNKKRGSKTYRSIVLSASDRNWEFFHPSRPNTHFAISYSEAASKDIKLDDVLKAYRP